MGPAAMSCAVLLIGPNLRGGSLGGQLGGLLPINAVRLSLGVLLDVQKYFHISDSHAGLLQTGKEPVLDPGTKALLSWCGGFCGQLQTPSLLQERAGV